MASRMRRSLAICRRTFRYGRHLGQGAEGTAMLEIIRDIAPHAELFFGRAQIDNPRDNPSPLDPLDRPSPLDPLDRTHFNQAIQWLLDQDVKIIVDDIGFRNEPVYEDGIVAKFMRTTAQENPDVIFVTSAGNDAQGHYESTFTPLPDGDGSGIFDDKPRKLHNFDASGAAAAPFINATLQKGTNTFYVYWDDEFSEPEAEFKIVALPFATGQVFESDLTI